MHTHIHGALSLSPPGHPVIKMLIRKSFAFHVVVDLSGVGLDLLLGTPGTLLADDALGLALGGGGGLLGLLGLLGGRGLGLLLFALLDGLGTGGGTGLGAHGSLLLDHIERGTNDGTLGLDGAAGALLRGFL